MNVPRVETALRPDFQNQKNSYWKLTNILLFCKVQETRTVCYKTDYNFQFFGNETAYKNFRDVIRQLSKFPPLCYKISILQPSTSILHTFSRPQNILRRCSNARQYVTMGWAMSRVFDNGRSEEISKTFSLSEGLKFG